MKATKATLAVATLLAVLVGGATAQTRADMSGGQVPATFCAESDGTCNWEGYQESVLLIGLPFFILAGLSCLAIPGFCIGRCLGLFGGGDPSYGFFLSKDPHLFQGYDQKNVLILRVCIGVWCVVVSGLAIFGWGGETKLNRSLELMTETLSAAAIQVHTSTEVMIAELLVLNATKASGEELQETAKQTGALKDQVEEVDAYFQSYNQARSWVFIVTFMLPFLVLNFASWSAVFFRPGPIRIACNCVFITSLMAWACFGLALPVRVVVGDLCQSLEVENSTDSAAKNSLLQCNGETFVKLLDVILAAQLEACNDVRESGSELCEDGLFVSGCPASLLNYTNTTCDENEIYALANETVLDFQYRCFNPNGTAVTPCDMNSQAAVAANPLCAPPNTVQQCNVRNLTLESCVYKCTNDDAYNSSDSVMTSIQTMKQYSDVLIAKLVPLMDCAYAQEAFEKISDSLCDDMKQGTEFLAIASGVIAFLFIGATIMVISGEKRLDPNLKKSDRNKLAVAEGESVKQAQKRRALLQRKRELKFDRDRALAAFKKFDLDNSGDIDIEEFTLLVKMLGIKLDGEGTQKAFDIIDLDGNGTLDWSEFWAWWKGSGFAKETGHRSLFSQKMAELSVLATRKDLAKVAFTKSMANLKPAGAAGFAQGLTRFASSRKSKNGFQFSAARQSSAYVFDRTKADASSGNSSADSLLNDPELEDSESLSIESDYYSEDESRSVESSASAYSGDDRSDEEPMHETVGVSPRPNSEQGQFPSAKVQAGSLSPRSSRFRKGERNSEASTPSRSSTRSSSDDDWRGGGRTSKESRSSRTPRNSYPEDRADTPPKAVRFATVTEEVPPLSARRNSGYSD